MSTVHARRPVGDGNCHSGASRAVDRRAFAAAVAIVVCGLMGTAALADDWRQWRGPEGNSVSRAAGLPLTWSETAGVVWKRSLPDWGTSTPCIVGDPIFLTTEHEQQLLILALDRATGEMLWTRQVATAPTPREADKRTVQKFHRLHNNASPSPVSDGQTVVVHFGSGDLAAYDFAGQQLWHRNLQQDHGTYTIWWGHANSPVIYEDLVISVCMQDSLAGVQEPLAASYLVAHELLTGQQRWYTPRMTGADAEECDAYTTPILHRGGEGVQLIVMGGNQLDAYDPATGRQLWWLPGLQGGRTITGPTLAHDVVYATRGMRGELVAAPLAPPGAGTAGPDQQPADAQQLAGLLEPAERSRDVLLWTHGDATPDSCCPVVVDDLVFTVSDNGIAQCLDARSGEVYWKQRVPGDYKASPLSAEGRVYLLNTEGLTTVVRAAREFEVLAENQLEAETIASPAVGDSFIYLRSRDALYCLGRP